MELGFVDRLSHGHPRAETKGMLHILLQAICKQCRLQRAVETWQGDM